VTVFLYIGGSRDSNFQHTTRNMHSSLP
jgi:hypothetical protein